MVFEIDPEKIDLERLHTSTDGLIGPNEDNNPPWLNSVPEVDALVRTFAADVLCRYSDEKDTDAFMKWLDWQCVRKNLLFLGHQISEDELMGYKRGPWNTPGQLGNFLRIRYVPSEEDLRFAVRDAFMRCALDVVSESNTHVGEPVESWGWGLDAVIEQLVRALLGLPPGFDPDIEGVNIDIYPAK